MGLIESPVFLTSTMQLGRVYDAACVMQMTRTDVAPALAAARASVGAESAPDLGAVGAGTGMSCLGFKGGIGTAPGSPRPGTRSACCC